MWNKAKLFVLGRHLCPRIWVHTMIGLLKIAFDRSICQSDWREISKCISSNPMNLLEAQNKDIGTALQTLLTRVKLLMSAMQVNKFIVMKTPVILLISNSTKEYIQGLPPACDR